MGTRSSLAQQLDVLSGFEDPTTALEQYHTPGEIAAHLIHLAGLQDDLHDRPVVDLGAGTGILAVACALRGADPVLGLELDTGAIGTARENAREAGCSGAITWLRGDARRPPIGPGLDTTVVMNPPFGAQDGNAGADKAFLDSARQIASVSYSIHNGGSESFVRSYVDDHGDEITHAFAVELELDHQFDFHDRDRESIPAEAYRIEWPS